MSTTATPHTNPTSPDPMSSDPTNPAPGASGAGVPDLRGPLFAAQEWIAELLEGVDPQQLTAATPCTEFTVRELMAHVALVQDKITGFGTDHRDLYRDQDATPEQMAAAREELAVGYIDDVAPDQWSTRSRARAAAAMASWTEDTLDAPIQLGWGPILPGRIVAGIYLMELLAHGWDLATATGQPSEAPTAVAQVGLMAAQQGLPETPRGVEVGVPFGAVVPSAPDAGPTERLANWTGRVSR
ncbi:MAG: TIGR03086 family protein [Phycicoccus sp.]|nr:TIGR03086 family protein [Phycicoccus sp.]